MSDGSKRYKGQLQTVDGSFSGEPIITILMDYDASSMPIYAGETKVGTQQDDARWFITSFQYDMNENLISITTASNKMTTNATAVSVDTSSYPGFSLITLTEATLTLMQVNDKIFLTTGSNAIAGDMVTQLISASSFLIKNSGQVDETNTSITSSDFTLQLESKLFKEYDHRRWDLRTLYYYV